jgi:transporter family protein
MNWILWALLSAFFAGVTAVLAKKGVMGMDSNLAVAIRTSVVVVFSWLLFLISKPADASSTVISRNSWVFLILSGLATGLSWMCYFRALQLGPASRVAPVDKLSVVFAIIFAVLFLGEQLKWQHWTGAAFILAGALLMAIK